MCQVQRRFVIVLVGVFAVACDRGTPAPSRPTPAPCAAPVATPAPAEEAPRAVPADPRFCQLAVDTWTTLPEIPTENRTKSMYQADLQPQVLVAVEVLSSKDAFVHCHDFDLVRVLEVSIARLEDRQVVDDNRGKDGVRIDVRYAATTILTNLSGQTFGTFSIMTFWDKGCDEASSSDDPSVMAKWQAWWQQVQKDPRAVIVAARTGKVAPFVFEGELGARFAREDAKRAAARLACKARTQKSTPTP